MLDINLLNAKEWNNILESIKNKKIVIFGAGNNGSFLIDIIPYKISYFIDNAKQKWNQTFKGIPVYSPEKLKEEKDEIAVLISGYLYRDMIHQLESFNLRENIKIYNVYEIAERAINKYSFSKRGEECLSFLRDIPECENITNVSNREKISIVISNFKFGGAVWHLIVIAVLMKIKGTNVNIIWDDLEGYDDLYYDWEKATITQNSVIKKVLKYVEERFGIEVVQVSKMEELPLDELDRIHLEKLAQINTISKYRVNFITDKLNTFKIKCFEVLEKNLKRIKYLFNNIKVDKIVSFTGIHGKAGLYTWEAKKRKIQVCSYDVTDMGLMISTSGIVCHQMDIKKIIEQGYLSKDLKNKLIHFAKKDFSSKLKYKNSIENGIYQIVEYLNKKNYSKFDVIIPLNIAWDAAALGKHRFFESMGQWVMETVEYILENTRASVAVRQHPAERKFKSGEDLKQLLQERFYNNPRFSFISAEEEINTYNLIEKSKLVLPHTSTVGVEAALLHKPIILESDAYYSELSFAEKAQSKEDYFKKIKECLDSQPYKISKQSLEEALLCYGILKFNTIKTNFTHQAYLTWFHNSYEDLIKDKSVEKIINTFSTGKPLALTQIEDYFKV